MPPPRRVKLHPVILSDLGITLRRVDIHPVILTDFGATPRRVEIYPVVLTDLSATPRRVEIHPVVLTDLGATPRRVDIHPVILTDLSATPRRVDIQRVFGLLLVLGACSVTFVFAPFWMRILTASELSFSTAYCRIGLPNRGEQKSTSAPVHVISLC